jgi:solute carrier family 25 carnitine/acylcarnitine transporter 20/29
MAKGETTTLLVGPSAIVRSMISDFGVTSLWRGSSAMIGAVPIQNALLMTGYGFGKRWSGLREDSSLEDEEERGNVLLGVFVGGCTGEWMVLTFVYTLWMEKRS